MKPLRATACLLLAIAAPVTAQIPSSLSRVHGATDTDLPTPQHSSKTTSDLQGAQSMLSFATMSGITGWVGLTAHGTITYAGDDAQYPATLSLLGSDHYRLDVTKARGKEVTLSDGEAGVFSSPDIATATPPEVAWAGLSIIPKLLSSTYPRANSVILDHGITTISGVQTRRVSFEDPSTGAGPAWNTSDLYFDLGSHRLLKSTFRGRLSSADRNFYMFETSYEDYRQVNEKTLPYRIVRSINGNPLWTLSLNTIDTTAIPTLDLFHLP